MKKFLSVILAVAVLFCGSVFADTNKSVEELGKYGVMQGDPDGSMRLEDSITRAEAATLILRMYIQDTSKIDNVPQMFDDMSGHWAEKEVGNAKLLGLVDGTSETSFEPEKLVSAQEFIKMAVILLGYKELAEGFGGYPNGYIEIAKKIALLANVQLNMEEPLTRGNAAVMLSNSLDIPLMRMTGFGKEVSYMIMNGENGVALETLRILNFK